MGFFRFGHAAYAGGWIQPGPRAGRAGYASVQSSKVHVGEEREARLGGVGRGMTNQWVVQRCGLRGVVGGGDGTEACAWGWPWSLMGLS